MSELLGNSRMTRNFCPSSAVGGGLPIGVLLKYGFNTPRTKFLTWVRACKNNKWKISFAKFEWGKKGTAERSTLD